MVIDQVVGSFFFKESVGYRRRRLVMILKHVRRSFYGYSVPLKILVFLFSIFTILHLSFTVNR